jgi:hypothetical protein
MQTVLIAGASLVAGVALGLFLARLHAQNKLDSGIDSLLGKVGLSGGFVSQTAQSLANQTVFS